MFILGFFNTFESDYKKQNFNFIVKINTKNSKIITWTAAYRIRVAA